MSCVQCEREGEACRAFVLDKYSLKGRAVCAVCKHVIASHEGATLDAAAEPERSPRAPVSPRPPVSPRTVGSGPTRTPVAATRLSHETAQRREARTLRRAELLRAGRAAGILPLPRVSPDMRVWHERMAMRKLVREERVLDAAMASLDGRAQLLDEADLELLSPMKAALDVARPMEVEEVLKPVVEVPKPVVEVVVPKPVVEVVVSKPVEEVVVSNPVEEVVVPKPVVEVVVSKPVEEVPKPVELLTEVPRAIVLHEVTEPLDLARREPVVEAARADDVFSPRGDTDESSEIVSLPRTPRPDEAPAGDMLEGALDAKLLLVDAQLDVAAQVIVEAHQRRTAAERAAEAAPAAAPVETPRFSAADLVAVIKQYKKASADWLREDERAKSKAAYQVAQELEEALAKVQAGLALPAAFALPPPPQMPVKAPRIKSTAALEPQPALTSPKAAPTTPKGEGSSPRAGDPSASPRAASTMGADEEGAKTTSKRRERGRSLQAASPNGSPRRAFQAQREKLTSFFNKLVASKAAEGGAAELPTSEKRKSHHEPAEPAISHPFETPATAVTASGGDTSARAASPRLTLTARAGELDKRRVYILQEIIDTEADFLRDMEMIVELFLVPIRISGILSKADADALFRNVSHLIPIGSALLSKLREQAALPPASQRIGQVFIKFSDQAVLEYSHYASSSHASSQTMQSIAQTNERWNRFLAEAHTNPKLRDLKLDTYLIKPVQRVCRYPLLLRELQQATSPDCTDWADLKVAQERFNSVIGQINEMRRETENHLRQQQLADSMRSVPPDLDLCADGRHLLREATVAVMADGSKWRPHVLYMFTDCVVYATEAILGGHTFRGVAWFALALLNERPTADWAPKGEEGVVELVLVDKKKTMLLKFPSAAAHEEWTRDMAARIEDHLARAAQLHKQERMASMQLVDQSDDAPRSASPELPLKKASESLEQLIAELDVASAKSAKSSGDAWMDDAVRSSPATHKRTPSLLMSRLSRAGSRNNVRTSSARVQSAASLGVPWNSVSALSSSEPPQLAPCEKIDTSMVASLAFCAELVDAVAQDDRDVVAQSRLLKAVVETLKMHGMFGAFCNHLAQREFRGNISTWREPTTLCRVFGVCCQEGAALNFLDSVVGPFVAELMAMPDEFAKVETLFVKSLDAFLSRLESALPMLAKSWQAVAQAAFRASQRDARTIGIFLFLRFVVPFMSHPRHVSQSDQRRGQLPLAIRAVCSIANDSAAADQFSPSLYSTVNLQASLMNDSFFYKSLVRQSIEEGDVCSDVTVSESVELRDELYAWCSAALERGALQSAPEDFVMLLHEHQHGDILNAL